MQKYFSGTLRLTAFFIRRERIIFGIWLVVLLVLAWAVSAVFQNQMSPQELQAILIVRGNPAQVALQGPVYGVDNFLPGYMFAAEMHLFTMVGIGIMNIFIVMRLTRGDEEKGRYEVIRSLPVGRLSGLNAAIITAFLANLVIAVVHGVLLWALGIDGINMAGAFAYGFNLGVAGFFFAAITAFFAQLSPTARGAIGYAFGFLIAAFLLRAVGDPTNEALAMISPLGLIMRAQVFVGNYFWPVGIVLGLTVGICAVTYLLDSRRDMDQGYIPQRPGTAEASASLLSPIGLAWRLTRGGFIAWAVGMFALGASLGGLMGEAENFAGENEIFMAMMPHSPDFTITQLFTMLLNILLAIVCIAPVISMTLKQHAEERDHRAEYILGAAVSRTRYMMSYVVIGFAASVIMPFVTALGLWVVSSFTMGTPLGFGTMLWAIIVYVPALWVMLGLCVFIVGFAPKLVMLCWMYFGYAFIVGFFGDLLSLPGWAMRISPIGFVPMIPLDDVNVITMAGMIGVAAILTVGGIFFYKRRDLK
ncbi:MAG: ABC transporter permease [Defluviitaleaceae bacterium]|nr:ABC transporter permease [Defluviitaleaceae bacterium]